jgi:hypothetical protein
MTVVESMMLSEVEMASRGKRVRASVHAHSMYARRTRARRAATGGALTKPKRFSAAHARLSAKDRGELCEAASTQTLI